LAHFNFEEQNDDLDFSKLAKTVETDEELQIEDVDVDVMNFDKPL